MKIFITIFLVNIFLTNFTFAEQLSPSNRKCQISPGLGFSMEVVEPDFFMETSEDCFLILRHALYPILLEFKTNKGISIPVDYTDQNGNIINCTVEYVSSEFVPAVITDEYLATKTSGIKSQKDLQKILLNFIVEKNKAGLDQSVPLFCEFLGA